MDTVATLGIIWVAVLVSTIIIGAIVSAAQKAKKKANQREKERQIAEKHQANLYYLYQIGFKIDEQYHPEKHRIYVYFDYRNKSAALEYYSQQIPMCSDLVIFPLEKIVACEFVQNGSVVSREEGRIGGAVVLGYGAMGGTKQSTSVEMGGVLAIRLIIDDMRIPSVTINVLEASVSKASQEYQTYYFIAQELYGRFQGIVRINNAEGEKAAQQKAVEGSKQGQLPENIMDQLRKLSQLKGEGILTEQEFESKKKLLIEKL